MLGVDRALQPAGTDRRRRARRRLPGPRHQGRPDRRAEGPARTGPDTPRQDRLVDDARAAAMMSHPNIATLFDVGHHEGRLYLAYEYVQGTTLRQQMEGRPMNPRHALELAVQVADALRSRARPLGRPQGSPSRHRRRDREGQCQGPRFRHVRVDARRTDPGARGGRTGQPRRRGGDGAVLCLARTGRRRPRRCADRHLLARHDRLRDADRRQPLRRRRRRGDARSTSPQRVPPAPSSLVPQLPKMVDMVLSRALTKDLARRTESAGKLASRAAPLSRQPRAPRSGIGARRCPRPWRRNARDLLPLEEDRGGWGVWSIVAALGGGLGATVYYWLR